MPDYRRRTYVCQDCGAEVTRKCKGAQTLRCQDCGIRHAAAIAYQLARHSGEAYEQWARSAGPDGGRAHRSRKKE